MKGIDILTAFELEINKLNDTLQKPLTDDSLYWINQGVVKFTKDRFNGNAPKRTSYEQNEKRTRDLIGLLKEMKINDFEHDVLEKDIRVEKDSSVVVEGTVSSIQQNTSTQTTTGTTLNHSIVTGSISYETIDKDLQTEINNRPLADKKFEVIQHPSYDEYDCKYPEDLMFVLNEDVVISDLKGEHMMDTCVFECTADSFMYRINNKLTDFHYRFHRARPLRIRTKDGFKLLTDKKYQIKKYTLGYLKTPEEITSEDPYKEYTDFADNTWLEIIKIAAQMYIENQSDPRYKTITNEVLTQE